MQNDKLELPGGSYSVSDIPNYFEYIITKNETMTDNPPKTIYVNKIENRTTFKIKTGYYLKLLTPKLIKSLGIFKIKIGNDKNCENLRYYKSLKQCWSTVTLSTMIINMV